MAGLLFSGGLVVDGRGRAPVSVSLLVDRSTCRIAGVGSDDALGHAGVERIDVSGKWIVPGLVNAHEHLCLKDALTGPTTRNAYYQIYRQPESVQLFRGARGALASLAAGVTTVRDAGAMGQLSLLVRDAINSGLLVGPRVVSCGSPISVPFEGGGVNPPGMTVDAEGPDDVRERVRWLLDRGADYIKVKGHRRDFDSARTRVYSDAELAAAIEEGHAAGVKVTLHAWHTEVIEAAVRHGADCVEHGNPMSDSPGLASKMADANVAYVPNIVSWVPDPDSHNEAMNVKAAIAKEKIWPSTRMAIEAGVKIGVGTDLHTARMSDEMKALQRLGMSAMDAIVSATSVGAEIIGWSSQVGTIEVGKMADLVVLSENPLEDLSAFDTPEAVYLGGVKIDPQSIEQAIGTNSLPEPVGAGE